MELFTIGRRPLHRRRRLRRGARLHRLEPARSPATARSAESSLLRVRLQRQPARPDGQDVHLRDLSRRRHGRFRPAPPPQGDAGRLRPDRARWRATRRPRIAWRASSTPSSSASSTAPDERVISDLRERLHAERHQHQGGAAAAVHVATSSCETSEFTRYAWPVEFVVRADQGNRLERALGGCGDDAAGQHGPAAVRAARRQRLGARPRVVLDRVDAVADELRRDADGEPDVQPADGELGAVPPVARVACSITC